MSQLEIKTFENKSIGSTISVLVVFLILLFTMNAFTAERIPVRPYRFYFDRSAETFSDRSISSDKLRAPASLSRGVSAIATPSEIFYGGDGEAISPDLIANFNKLKKEEQKVDLTKFIPLDMPPGQDTKNVVNRVADQTIQTLFNSVEFRQSPVGAMSVAVQESLKTEVSLVRAQRADEVEHKLQMSLQAFQNYAQIQYSGYGKAAVKYFVDTARVSMEVTEKVAKNQNIILSHSVAPLDRASHLAYQIDF